MLFLLTVNQNITVWPSTTAPLISFQSSRANGCGLGFRTDSLDLTISYIQYSDSSSSSLISVSGAGWVRTRWGNLVKLNYRVPSQRVNFYVGANYLRLQDYEKFGYQLGVERQIDNLAFIRLGFQRIGEANSFSTNIGFDLIGTIKEAKNKDNI